MHSVHHIRAQKCCFGRPLAMLDVCSSERDQCTHDMNLARYLCCDQRKVLRRYGANSACCGSEVINNATETCCNGEPAPVISGGPTACCGQQSYNTDLAQCCPDNRVVPKCGMCSVTLIPPPPTTPRPTTRYPTKTHTTYGHRHHPYAHSRYYKGK